MRMKMEKGNFTNELSDEDRKAIWIKLLDGIGYKSFFDYTDEEWAPIELRLMRGAGRRYKDVVEALASVIQIKRAREAGRNQFPEEKDLIKEFTILYYLGYNRSDFILDELEKAEETEREEKDCHIQSAQEMYDYCKKNKEIIPSPIEDYFLKKRDKPSSEEVREWYLENKLDIKIDSFISNN